MYVNTYQNATDFQEAFTARAKLMALIAEEFDISRLPTPIYVYELPSCVIIHYGKRQGSDCRIEVRLNEDEEKLAYWYQCSACHRWVDEVSELREYCYKCECEMAEHYRETVEQEWAKDRI